jgi:hypothetical protein
VLGRAMKQQVWLGPLAAALILSGLACGSDTPPVTQVVVEVNADEQVALRLQRVRTFVYAPDAQADAQPLHQASFTLTDGMAADGVTHLPFSFGVVRKDTNEQLIVVLGYDTLSANADPIIEAKTLVRFREAHSDKVSIQLAEVCLNRARQCAQLDRSCSATGAPAGACARIRPQASDAGTDASSTEQNGAAPVQTMPMTNTAVMMKADAATPKVEMKTEPIIVDDRDASTGEDDSPAPNKKTACAAASCDAAYRCVESTSQGFSCEGQMAEWHMPDTVPNAKFKPSYDTSSDPEVVIDKITGLLWQKNLPKTYAGCTGKLEADGDSCTNDEAKNYCAQLDLQNAKWRLPSKIELETLVDMSHEGSGRAYLDNQAFPDAPEEGFWTSSPSIYGAENYAWSVSFAHGYSTDLMAQTGLKVRCIRSILTRPGTPADRYQVSVDGMTVSDTRTTLEWQRGTSETVTYEQAESYCASKSMRLPTLKELLTIVDPLRSDPAVDPVFEKTPTTLLLFASTPDPSLTAHTALMAATGSSVNDLVLQLPSSSTLSFTFRARCVH